MATRQHVSKARRDRSRPLKAPGGREKRLGRKTRPSEHVYGVPVPEGLHEAIEIERDNLSKAGSLLACMVVSMEYHTDPLTGPYYPAVAQMARELVDRSINGLDSLVLQQRLRRNKIEEVFCGSWDNPRISPPSPSEFKVGAHRLATLNG
jgi:hypothetical protein